MGDKYRLTAGTHRRTADDGTPVVFEPGDVFEPTDHELEAFGDKLERVAKDGDEWTPIRQSASEAAEPGEYRLVQGTHRAVDDGTTVVYEEGDVVELSADEVAAFGDKFERVLECDHDSLAEGESCPHCDYVADPSDPADVDQQEVTSDDTDDAGSADAETDSTEDAESAEIPEDLPDDYRDLQSLAKEFDIDARQSKEELINALEARRDSGGDDE